MKLLELVMAVLLSVCATTMAVAQSIIAGHFNLYLVAFYAMALLTVWLVVIAWNEFNEKTC